jgi:hypothetical protein
MPGTERALCEFTPATTRRLTVRAPRRKRCRQEGRREEGRVLLRSR